MDSGWLLRYNHMSGCNVLFVLVYGHMLLVMSVLVMISSNISVYVLISNMMMLISVNSIRSISDRLTSDMCGAMIYE